MELFNPQFVFKIATGLYGFSLLAAFLPGNKLQTVWLFLAPAILANAASTALHYSQAWPMLPMYLGPVALPFCLGVLVGLSDLGEHDGSGIAVRRSILALIALLSILATCFPKDFYLPFLKSKILFAHFFFFFGAAGKGCFLVGAAWAVNGLRRGNDSSSSGGELLAVNRSVNWTVWGFAFWTLSMFAGELWSYLGWGTPVVWDDAALAAAMATWFFYICLLHLHLTGTWTIRARAVFTAAGALGVLVLNFMPDLGPYRSPF